MKRIREKGRKRRANTTVVLTQMTDTRLVMISPLPTPEA